MNSRKKYILLMNIILLIVLSSCTTFDNFKKTFIEKKKEAESTVRIGVYQPMSGKDKEKGELEIRGIKLANKMFPEALGKKVELIYVDNQSDMDVAESAAKDLVESRVAVVLGSYGSVNSLVAVKIFEEAQIPAIAITNTNPLVTSYNPYYFRVCLLDSFQGVALAKYAVESLNLTAAAVMRPSGDDYAMALSDTFSNKFMQMTGNPNSIVSSIEYSGEQDNYDKELQEIKKSGAQAVFLPVEPVEAAKVLRAAKKNNYNFLFLGTNMWDDRILIEKAGIEETNGICFSTIFDSKTDTTIMSENFIKAYRREYGDDEPDSAVALGFDAYMIAIDSINKTGSALSGEDIRNRIAKTSRFPGSSGSITFDSNGDPIKSVVIKKIVDGKADATYTMEPSIVNLYQLSLEKSS